MTLFVGCCRFIKLEPLYFLFSCQYRCGFVIAVTTIESIGDGFIQPGRGFVVYPVKYKVLICTLIL